MKVTVEAVEGFVFKQRSTTHVAVQTACLLILTAYNNSIQAIPGPLASCLSPAEWAQSHMRAPTRLSVYGIDRYENGGCSYQFRDFPCSSEGYDQLAICDTVVGHAEHLAGPLGSPRHGA